MLYSEEDAMASISTFVRLQQVTGVPSVDPKAISMGAAPNRGMSNGHLPDSHQSPDVDIGFRLQEVCAALIESPACAGRVSLSQTVIGDALVRADCAGPIMLIVGEAVTNAVKYAHPTGVPGKVHVDCRRDKDGALLIEVADDGVGLPEGFNPATDGDFGFKLMRGLSDRLGAVLTFVSESLGLRMTLRVPAEACAAADAHTDASDSSARGSADTPSDSGSALGLFGDAAQSREFWRTLPIAMYVTDADGRIIFYNDAAAALWGTQPELGKTEFCGAWKLYWQDGTPMPHDTCPVAVALREQRPIRGITVIAERPDGGRATLAPHPTPLFDATGALIGAVNIIVELTEAVAERRQAHDRQELILAEMKHRIRNTLATVQAMAMETWRSATGDERSAFNARLRALADSHDLLTLDNWDRASLREVVARVLHPFTEKHSDRIQIDGPDLRLTGNQSLLLTMALHELATNAAKYGALCNGKGRVEIAWEMPPGDKSLQLVWRESGGPPVAAPDKRGFGSFLIERAFHDEHGRARIEFNPEGVVCTLGMAL
jgi:two-component sensor histidine kinase